jgi:hypothetical protein
MSTQYYEDVDYDDDTLLEMNSDIAELIENGQYDQAESITEERLSEQPSNTVLHRFLIKILELRQSDQTKIPQDSNATKKIKDKFLNLIKKSSVDLTHYEQFKYRDMIFNKFFYYIEYPDEKNLKILIESIPEFNLFKNN